MESEKAPTCKIQWVSNEGKPTPDGNTAVMLAHFHEPVWSMSSGCVGSKMAGYSEKIQQSFPICAEHYTRVTPEMLWPRGGWSFTSL